MSINKEDVRRAFAAYVADYDPEDPKIKLKIKHTYHVAALAEEIAGTVAGADPELAWLMGMLHDIGRFEQVRRYHTFIDAQSVDHAGFGADLLFQEGLLEQMAPGLSAEAAHLLEVSIRNHSAYILPTGLTSEEQMYCDILRDADKLDILRVMTDTPIPDIYNVSEEELRGALVSDAVQKCFRERMTVLRALKKTPIDFLVGHICLVFGLVYPASRKIAREQGCVDKLLGFESSVSATRQWFAYMRQHIWEEENE